LDKTDDILERVAETLKEPVSIDPDLDRRVMAEIGALPPDALEKAKPTWWSRRWTIRLSPVGGLAAAATLAALTLVAISQLRRESAVDTPVTATTDAPAKVTQFVLVAPNAKTVTLVGDFNDWNLAATSLARQDGDGVWWVTVALPPGRYRYAFVVDGTNWRGDPDAPAAEDDFGRPNSVVTVGGV
jgi:hypothetical protein